MCYTLPLLTGLIGVFDLSAGDLDQVGYIQLHEYTTRSVIYSFLLSSFRPQSMSDFPLKALL